jgi:hypothetical protein
MTRYHTVYVRCLDRAVTFSRCGWCGRKLADGATDCHEAFGDYCEPAKTYLQRHADEQAHSQWLMETQETAFYKEHPYG